MPLLRSTAEMLTQTQLERGVIETIIDRDDMLQMLPFQRIDGKALVYTRESELGSVSFLDPNDPVPESAVAVQQVTALLKIIAGDVDVDKFLNTTMNNTNDQTAIQIAAKVKGMGRKFHETVATGDSSANAKSFDGLARLTDAAYTFPVAANGGAVTLSLMDQLKDLVALGPDAYVMRRGTWRGIKSLLRAQGGNTATTMMMENFGYPVPCLDGIPVLLNDFLPANEVQGSATNTCSIYAARFNEADGLHGIVGGEAAGMVVENIGTVQNKDANRIRVKWYVGMALKSQRSLARLTGVTSI